MCKRSLPTPPGVGHMLWVGFLERLCLCFSYPSGCGLLIPGYGRPVDLVFRGFLEETVVYVAICLFYPWEELSLGFS